jgi:hypothetical protein
VVVGGGVVVGGVVVGGVVVGGVVVGGVVVGGVVVGGEGNGSDGVMGPNAQRISVFGAVPATVVDAGWSHDVVRDPSTKHAPNGASASRTPVRLPLLAGMLEREGMVSTSGCRYRLHRFRPESVFA